MRKMNLFITLFSLLISCTNSDSSERVYQSSHFKISYTQLDDKNIKDIADSLETHYAIIVQHLQSGELPVVNVHFYTNIIDLQNAVKVSVPNLPAWAIGLATSVSKIHMLSPNHPQQEYQQMIRNIIHEFAHCVSLKINPTIGNNPRWLWEAVAIYEGNLPWDPHMLPYLVNQKPPSLSELNHVSNTSIYEIGYFIADFIVQTKGYATLHNLIANNGNIKETLNLEDAEFTKQWFAFVQSKYGL